MCTPTELKKKNAPANSNSLTNTYAVTSNWFNNRSLFSSPIRWSVTPLFTPFHSYKLSLNGHSPLCCVLHSSDVCTRRCRSINFICFPPPPRSVNLFALYRVGRDERVYRMELKCKNEYKSLSENSYLLPNMYLKLKIE